MDELQVLKDAIAALNASFSKELRAIGDKVAATQSTTADAVAGADLAPVVDSINALREKVDAETAALTGVVPAKSDAGDDSGQDQAAAKSGE